MKRQSLFFILILTAYLNSQCQTSSIVQKVEFTSLTRGFHKQIIISPDSVSVITQGRDPQSYRRSLTKKEWHSLQKILADVAVTDIQSLQSPTQKRAYDGALHSALTLVTPGGQTSTHSFDDEDPHPSLKPLLKKILTIGRQR